MPWLAGTMNSTTDKRDPGTQQCLIANLACNVQIIDSAPVAQKKDGDGSSVAS